MKAIIPIGGRGTRMRPVTFTANKHFIPIGNKPLIFYPIETIQKSGIKKVAITYNPGQLEFAQSLLGSGAKWGLEFTYIEQPNPIGLANIIEVCEKWIGTDQFVLHLGDNIYLDGIHEAVSYFKKNKPDGLVLMLHHNENTRLGVPYFNKNNRLTQYVEKPTHPPHDFAIPGLYFGNKNFFKAYKGKDRIKPSPRGEYEIPSPYQWLIDHNYRVDVIEYKGVWLDPGKFNDWINTNKILLDKMTVASQLSKPINSKLRGVIQIGKNCDIKKTTINGPVAIGDNVTIYNCIIDPHTSIYNNCELKNCHIKNSVLMEHIIIKNIDKPIDASLLGPHTEITGGKDQAVHQLFIGEMGKLSL